MLTDFDLTVVLYQEKNRKILYPVVAIITAEKRAFAISQDQVL
jgi:hypothetical protein